MKTKIISFCLLLFFITSPVKAQQWEFVGLDSMIINQIYILNDTIWASTAHRLGNLDKSGMYKSTDRGNYWIRLDDSLGNGHVSLFLIDRYNTNDIWIIKGYSAYGIEGILFRTIDGGENWNYAQNITQNVIQWFGISPFNNNEMYFIDQTYAPGGFLNSLFKSSNGGYSWQGIGNFPSSSHGRSIVFNISMTDSNKLYAAINDRMGGEYLYISNNKRSSWNYISEPPAIERELLTDPSLIDRIFIFPGYYLTEDGGYTWTVADSGLPDVNSYLSFYFDTTDKTIFYNLRKDGLYKTRNNPINWQLIKGSDSLPLNLGGQGFQYYDIGMLKNVFIDTLYNVIYVGTASGIYKKDLITEVKEKTNNITSEFILNQNYPNPFNPTTTISYQIPEKRFVTISVYDVLGNEIATLVNKEQPAGKYDVEFDATRLSSGVYFYRLQAGSYFKIKKMVLTK
jgi:hypothetical protein